MTSSLRSQKKKASHKLLFVQSLIDIKSVLNSLSYTDRFINDHLDKYHYVIHKINEQKIFSFSDSSYSILNFNTLVEVLGARYTKMVLDNLKSWGIIESDNQYIKGEKSKGYRITAAYQSKLIGLDIIKDTFEAKLARISAANIATYTKPAQYIYGCLKHIRINKAKALEFIDNKLTKSIEVLKSIITNSSSIDNVLDVYEVNRKKWGVYSLMTIQSDEISLLNTDYQLDKVLAFLQTKLTENYNLDLMAIEKIDSQDFELQQPDLESRIYTVLTSLSKDLRNYLNHKSNALVNIDIRNSQPFIFNMILVDHYKNRTMPADVDVLHIIGQILQCFLN